MFVTHQHRCGISSSQWHHMSVKAPHAPCNSTVCLTAYQANTKVTPEYSTLLVLCGGNHRSTLQWRHNEPDGVSNHQPHDCLLNRYSGADQRKYQSSTSLAFVRGIHRWPVNSPHKGPVTRKMFPFDDVIMNAERVSMSWRHHVVST